jgi:hypothetical protein
MRRWLPLALLLSSVAVAQSPQTGAMWGLPNFFTANDSFAKGVLLGPVTVSQLPSLTGLTNVITVSDGNSGTSPCTGGGSGALAIYVGGVWTCAVGASGTTYTFFGNTANPLTALVDPTTIIDAAGNLVAFTSTSLQLEDAALDIIELTGGQGCIGVGAGCALGPGALTLIASSNVQLAVGSAVCNVTSTGLTCNNVTTLASIVDSGLTPSTSPICPHGTSGAFTTIGCIGNGFPSTAQTGDIVRYNVNGDTAWDAVSYAAKQSVIYADLVGQINEYGAIVSGVNVYAGGSQGNVYPTTYVDAPARQLISLSSASTSTTIGISTGQNGNFGTIPFGSWYRWTHRFAANQTTNARYWMGVGSFCNGGTGGNGTAVANSTAYANDTPNKSTIGFRFSAGVDTTWQAVAITAGASSGSQTTANTEVAIDTNPHTFEIIPVVSSAGVLSAYLYFIDHVQVASITTNIPSGIYTGSCDPFGMPFWTGDNKNTANVVSGTFYYMTLSLR